MNPTTVIEVLADDLDRIEVTVRFAPGEWTDEGVRVCCRRFERRGLVTSLWVHADGSAEIVGLSPAEARRRCSERPTAAVTA